MGTNTGISISFGNTKSLAPLQLFSFVVPFCKRERCGHAENEALLFAFQRNICFQTEPWMLCLPLFPPAPGVEGTRGQASSPDAFWEMGPLWQYTDPHGTQSIHFSEVHQSAHNGKRVSRGKSLIWLAASFSQKQLVSVRTKFTFAKQSSSSASINQQEIE